MAAAEVIRVAAEKKDVKLAKEKAAIIKQAALQAAHAKLKAILKAPSVIYLSSSQYDTPALNLAIKAYLEGTVGTGDRVSIIALNDAKPLKKSTRLWQSQSTTT